MIKYILTDTAKKLKQEQNIDVTPTRGSKYAAGMDLSACIEQPVVICPGTITKIYTGVRIFLDPENGDDFAQLAGLYLPRSSNSELVLANTVGLLDCDFQGESFLKVTARENCFTINPGDKLAQLVIVPAIMLDWEETNSFGEETERGSDGDGSTGGNYTHRE